MKKYLSLIFFFTFFLISCGGGGGSGGSPKNQVGTTPPIESDPIVCLAEASCSPPTVSMLTPTNAATNVALSPSIQLQFNESVVNVNPATVQLHQGSENGIVVAIGQITAGADNIYTFSPQLALQPATTYYVTLSGEISNLNGILLVPTIFNFTTMSTSPAPGSNPPTVAIITPSNGATGVLLNPTIQLQFSMPVENVNSTTVKLHQGNKSGAVVAIGQITAGDNNTYTFSSESALRPDTSYYVTLSDGITNLDGVALEPTFFNFTTQIASTAPESEAPTVSLLTPSNNAVNISLSPSIQLQFSMVVKHVNITNVTLHEGSLNGQIVVVDDIIAGSNNTYTFSPVFLLNQSTKYYVVLSDKITNDAGIALVPASFSFTTGNFTIPVASMVSPNNNATNVSTYPSIQIKFSVPVLHVNTSNVTIHQGTVNGPTVFIGSITPEENNIYTLSDITLNENTKYYIKLSNGITSSSGAMLATTVFNFTTGANITFAGPSVPNYVANGEKMLFTNNSGGALTIVSINANLPIKVLFPSAGDQCTNQVIPNHGTCSVDVSIPKYYEDPTLSIMTVKYSNGSSTFSVYVSYDAYY